MDTNDKLLNAELRRDEGVKYKPYKDTVGIWTIGVGHNMEAKPIPKDWTFPLTDAQVDQLLAGDLQDVFKDLDNALPWWRNLSYVRQRALANMCYNLGITRLLGFKNTLSYIQSARWKDAAQGMMSSKWAKQVGNRATRLAEMMVKG